jgi:hypothetical protein
MQLLWAGLYGDNCIGDIDNSVNWEEVYQILGKNGLLPMVYPVIAKNKDILKVPDILMTPWKKYALYCSVSEGAKKHAIQRIVEGAHLKNLTLVIFKGCVIAEAYPQPSLRTSCDTDILVYENELAAAMQFLQELGYASLENGEKKKVFNFYSEELDHKIELHTCLWEDLSGPIADILIKMKLDQKESLIQVMACDVLINTLGYTQHLIFQMFHIIKHFSIEGVTAKYLVDITVYINKYFDKIDLNRFWNSMEMLGYSTFCMVFFELCYSYLNLNSEIFNNRERYMIVGMDDLLIDIINVGRIFDKPVTNWQVMPMMMPYLSGQKNIDQNQFKYAFHRLFPSPSEISDVYAYAKKNMLLLPIAWVHRGIKYFAKKEEEEKDGECLYDKSEKKEVFDHKIKLMRTLGLFTENTKPKKQDKRMLTNFVNITK